MAARHGLFVLSLAGCVAATGAARASDAFCWGLKDVIGEAGRGFLAFRGAQVARVADDGGGDDGVRYATTKQLPGATACGIDRSNADGDPLPPVYLCWFAPSPRDEEASRIASRIRECLGARRGDRGIVPAGDAGVALDIQRPDFVLSLKGDQGAPTILAVSGK